MKLTEKSLEVFEFIKANGTKVAVEEIATNVGRTPRSVNANITDLFKKGLVVRETEGEGEDKVVYAVLTEEGQATEGELKD